MAGYIHAKLMADYAKDAAETTEPWKRWEYRLNNRNQWFQCTGHPHWYPNDYYRRKPQYWERLQGIKEYLSACGSIPQNAIDLIEELIEKVEQYEHS